MLRAAVKTIERVERRLCGRFATAGKSAVFFLGRGKEGELCSVDKKGKKDQNVCIIFVGVVKRVQTIDRQRSRRVCFNKGKRTGGVQLGGFLPLVVFA
jgi:hypothetical protein